MIITYFGKQFFKITQGEMTIAVNPVGKGSKTGVSARFGADIALSTTNHPDYNGFEQVSHGGKAPFLISGPGDYEVKGITVRGALSDAVIGGKNYVNTIYSLELDGMTIVHLGAMTGKEVPDSAKEIITEPDILIVPVDADVTDAKTSAKRASAIEPKLIIPMDYDEKSLKAFLKELGEEKAETVEKLTIKRKDLEGKEGEVVVLSAQG